MTSARGRVSTVLLVVAIGAAAAVAGASGGRLGVRLSGVPGRVVQGKPAAVTVAVRSGTRCSFGVHYADGAKQAGLLPSVAASNRISWRWTVPSTAALGVARLNVVCPTAGNATSRFTVVGPADAAKVVVAGSGFSVRTRSVGSKLSFGVMLRNVAKKKDAVDVSVLVSLVGGNGTLIGSRTLRVARIPVGQTYALGDSINLPAGVQVAKLEVVVQPRSAVPTENRTPLVENVHLTPALSDATYLGAVEGELVNDDAKLLLQRARLSVVVLDATGTIIGGGRGLAFTTLPAGSRELFKLTSGFDAVQLGQAASVVISVEADYVLPDT
jgi:hypothetical protein